jgi:hypothetical protein
MASQALRSLYNRSNLPFWAEESPARAGLFFLERRLEMLLSERVKLSEWLVPPIVLPILFGLLVTVAVVAQW